MKNDKYVSMTSIDVDIMSQYIDVARKKLKVAKSFSVNYFGNCIPKNAVYGRATQNIYVYVDDFKQFDPSMKYTRFAIWVLDQRKHGRFHKVIVEKHSSWWNMLFAYIAYHDLFDVKCIPVNCVNRAGGKPLPKEPQTKTGYMYKTGVYSQNRVDPWCYECIDTDVTRKVDRYRYIDIEKYNKKYK